MGIIEKTRQELESQFIYWVQLIELIVDIEKCTESVAVEWLLSTSLLENQIVLMKVDGFSLTGYPSISESTKYGSISEIVYDAHRHRYLDAINILNEIGFPRKSILYALSDAGLQIPQELLENSTSYIPTFNDDSEQYCVNSGNCSHTNNQLQAAELEIKGLKSELDNLKKQPKNDIGTHTIGHATQQDYQKQRDQLQIELIIAKQRITELEKQLPQQQNEKVADDNTRRNSDLLLISALMTMLVGEKRAYNQSNRLQEIENNASGMTGLSTSRTTKVLSDANKLYKSLKVKHMKQ